MVKAHGGSKNLVSTQRKGGLMLGGILEKTTTNMPKEVHMRSLDNLIANTTGMIRDKPIMDGVIASTVPMGMKDTPEIHKVPAKEVGKTKAERMGQVPFAGKMY
jgi:hypothetical protein